MPPLHGRSTHERRSSRRRHVRPQVDFAQSQPTTRLERHRDDGDSTTVEPLSMNEASDRDPFNNNCYGTLVDRDYKQVNLPVLDVIDFNERDHPRLRGRLRREGPARRPVAGPLADPRRHRDAARLQLHRPGNPGVHPRELHRLHGLRHRVPRHRHPRQGAGRDRAGREAADAFPTRPTARCSRSSGRRPRSITTGRRRRAAPAACSTSSSTRSKCKGCAECVTVCDDDALKMIPKTDDVMDDDPQEPPLLQELRPVATRSTSTTTC